jgi:hypothetical protein
MPRVRTCEVRDGSNRSWPSRPAEGTTRKSSNFSPSLFQQILIRHYHNIAFYAFFTHIKQRFSLFAYISEELNELLWNLMKFGIGESVLKIIGWIRLYRERYNVDIIWIIIYVWFWQFASYVWLYYKISIKTVNTTIIQFSRLTRLVTFYYV